MRAWPTGVPRLQLTSDSRLKPMKPTAEELATFRRGVEHVPYLQLLGIELESLGSGEAEMSMLVKEAHTNTRH